MTGIRPKIEGSVRIEELRRAFYSYRRSHLSLVGLALMLAIIFVALFAESLASYPQDVEAVHLEQVFQPPSTEHFFGTDEAGRDVFSRVLIGCRLSVSVAVVVILLALTVGVPLGLVSGYRGGLLDSAFMRLADMFLSIPTIVLALAVSVALGEPSLEKSMLAISFSWWPLYARLVRGEVLHIKQEDYIQSAISFGASPSRIVFKEILPNIVTPVIVKATLDIGYAILIEAALGFLGLGAQPPTPEWGTMVNAGRHYIPEAWWLTTFPGLAIFLAVFAFCLVGDGLRDAFAG